jgi:hypothetical protein
MSGKLLFLALCLQLISFANAFSCVGHMIVAEIAFQLLPDKDHEYFKKIIDYQEDNYSKMSTAYEIACWPDDIKSYDHKEDTWHYFDQCYRPSKSAANCPTTDAGMLPTALADVIRTLKEGYAKHELKDLAFAFAFLLHLYGDAHQPLHLCTLFDAQFPNGDKGGNDFDIYCESKHTNLHSFNDNLGYQIDYTFHRPIADYPADDEKLRGIATSYRTEFAIPYDEAKDQDIHTWEKEAFDTCSTLSYEHGMLKTDAHLSDEYLKKNREMLRRKAVLAGVRLSNMMHEIYLARDN